MTELALDDGIAVNIANDTAVAVAAAATAVATSTAAEGFADDAAAAAADAEAAAAVAMEPLNVVGYKNLWPDPFLTETSLALGFRDQGASSPLTFAGGWTGIQSPPSNTPYPVGRALVRPISNVTTPVVTVRLEALGFAEGDSIEAAVEACFLGASSATSGTGYLVGTFKERDGTTIGSSWQVITPTTPAPLEQGPRVFASGAQTVPAGAFSIEFSSTAWGYTHPLAILSWQLVKGNALPKPAQLYRVPDDVRRLLELESYAPGSLGNGVLQRKSTYASATSVGPSSTGTLHTFAAFGGYGGSFLAAVVPLGGFDAVGNQLTWETTLACPSRIYAEVRTCATGKNPLNEGKLIAWGYIDVDPLAGSAAGPIMLFQPSEDGMPETPKTVVPADCLDLVSICYYGVTSTGADATGVWVTYGTTVANVDPALSGYFIGSRFGGWSAIGSSLFVPTLLKTTGAVTTHNNPSTAFAGKVGLSVDEGADMIGLPPKVWCVVGKSYKLQFDNVQHREARRTDYFVTASAAWPGSSGPTRDGIDFTPAAAGTITATVRAGQNGTTTDTDTVAFVTVATSAGAGTVRGLALGTSITESGATQARLNALADGTTAIVNLGTKGSNPTKNEGYSGQPLGIFRTSGNPFHNAGSFDFSYYMANSLPAQADPTHVYFEVFWDMIYAVSDGAAESAARFVVDTINTYTADIKAHSAAINVGLLLPFLPPRHGLDGQRTSVNLTTHTDRQRRNLLIAAEVFIDSLASSTDVDLIPVGQMTDSVTAYPRGGLVPVNPAISAQVATDNKTYATYTAMVADLTPANGTLCFVTDGSEYFRKVGGASGYWRAVTEDDGFHRVYSDTIHPTIGYNTAGDQVFAWMKATL